MHRVFRERLESPVQTGKILPRPVQSKIENRVFVDELNRYAVVGPHRPPPRFYLTDGLYLSEMK